MVIFTSCKRLTVIINLNLEIISKSFEVTPEINSPCKNILLARTWLLTFYSDNDILSWSHLKLVTRAPLLHLSAFFSHYMLKVAKTTLKSQAKSIKINATKCKFNS